MKLLSSKTVARILASAMGVMFAVMLSSSLQDVPPVFAQTTVTTVLPSAAGTDCKTYIDGTGKPGSLKGEGAKAFKTREGLAEILKKAGEDKGEGRSSALSKILGCAIQTGRIHLYMVPFFITYFIQFLSVIAGLVAVLFVAIGGFKYVVGGLSDDKDSGKKTITSALIGLVVALSSWIIVNFVQLALTS